MQVSNSGGGKDFPRCPEGLHQAVCVDVYDRGLVKKTWEGKEREVRQVLFIYQAKVEGDDGKEERDENGERYTASALFTASLSEKSKLLPFLEAWLGQSIPDEVRKSGFDLDKLIGRNAQITVVHGQGNNGKTYANIKGILPIGKNVPKLEPEKYTRVRDREGYEPPYGSDDWEAAQAAQQDASPGKAGKKADPDDDLPF